MKCDCCGEEMHEENISNWEFIKRLFSVSFLWGLLTGRIKVK